MDVRLLALLLLCGCVQGKDLLGPSEPMYAEVCVDSTLVDTTVVCWSDVAVIPIVVGIPDSYPGR